MRSKIYTLVVCIVLATIAPPTLTAQNCALLQATSSSTESRCFATGAITINATGGSGNYNYKVSGPVNTSFTSSNIITGLQAGTYLVDVKDIATGCAMQIPNVVVSGSYSDPRFMLNKTDIVCMGAADGSISAAGLTNGRSPFTYTIIAPSPMGVGTTNSTGSFTNLVAGDYLVQLKDSCGGIQTRAITIVDFTWWIDSYSVTRSGCTDANASITLKDSKGNLNTSGSSFAGYTYGYLEVNGDTTWLSTRTFTFTLGLRNNVTLVAKDNCGNVKKAVWTNTFIPTLGASVTISSKTCTGYTATITGQQNLTSPNYCLYNASDVLITCNTTGVFNNLPYGAYCIKIKDGCYDTTITRCFSQWQPVPALGASVSINGQNCTGFNASVTSPSNLTNPQYCLFDAANVQISCNTTGTFTSVPYGSYCIKMTDGCYDTTITRCFNVNNALPSVGNTVNITNKICSGFTANITGQQYLTSPTYCLFDSTGTQVSCNSTGAFNGVPYGNSCIQIKDGCYDTTITRCFSVVAPIPAVAASVTISNKGCNTFTATVTGQANLTTPYYRLFDSSNTAVDSNATGLFNNIPYGNYCIRVHDGCYDTTLSRCFTVQPIAMTFAATATPSCNIGNTNFNLTVANGNPGYDVFVINAMGDTVTHVTSATNTIAVNDLPDPGAGIPYTFSVVDACGRNYLQDLMANPGMLIHSVTVKSKCPSGKFQNGAGDIHINLSSNKGLVTPVVISKNFAPVTVNYTSISGTDYLFLDMDPAVYVMQYSIAGCTNKYYDTITVYPYSFPNLNKSAAYQCDNNSFSVGAAATNGVGPFTYEIIGSNPTIPNITAAPQLNPVFNITNGTAYSLVRLRATDACGNATLNDVSILPLANILVNTTSNCFFDNITLSVDTIPNASYTWYKKTSPVDSAVIGSGVMNYNFSIFRPADTGIYVCKMSVNSGCLTKISSFTLDGSCNGFLVLPLKTINFTGKSKGGSIDLNWVTTEENNQLEYVVERGADADKGFTPIGKVSALNGSRNNYDFTDANPLPGNNFYRLKMVDKFGRVSYSKTLVFDGGLGAAIKIYPNPAKDHLTIVISGRVAQNYQLVLFSASGQTVYQRSVMQATQETVNLNRNTNMKPGIYMLKVNNLSTGDITTYKILFE